MSEPDIRKVRAVLAAVAKNNAAGKWVNAFSTGLTQTAALANFTFVDVLPISAYPKDPLSTFSKVRLTWKGPVFNAYIGHKAGSGDAYDFAAAPVAITWGGASTLDAAAATITISDEISFAWNGTSDILIAYEHIGSKTFNYITVNPDCTGYFKSATGETATVNKTGYTIDSPATVTRGLIKLELFSNADRVTTNVVCDGNSLTAGTGTAANEFGQYPTQLQAYLGERYSVVNIGVPSATTAQRDAANATAAQIVPGKTNIAVLWEITNDLFFGGAQADAYARYVTWCQNVKAEGFDDVVAVTVDPRSDGGTPGTFETDRQAINTLIRANWPTFADALADVAADTRIGDSGDQSGIYYAGDNVHMNPGGYRIVASIIKSAIDTL